MMGNCYTHGYGVPQDDKLAVYWWTKAADQGDVDAQMILANTYSLGDGVRKNNKKAFHWYKQAAEQGQEDALDIIRAVGNC